MDLPVNPRPRGARIGAPDHRRLGIGLRNLAAAPGGKAGLPTGRTALTQEQTHLGMFPD